jgi:hypothetical protein
VSDSFEFTCNRVFLVWHRLQEILSQNTIIANVFKPCAGQLVLVSQVRYGLQAIQLTFFREGNCDWTEFANFGVHIHGNDDTKLRTRPKPDLTYAFPVTTSQSQSLKRFERDEYARSFSLKTLGDLSMRGIYSTPTTGLRMWAESRKRASLRTTDLACFPWAVIEFKKQVQGSQMSPVERCYCQAANASAAALELRAQMFVKASHDIFPEIAPVISFTCVGPIVKVWLTFFLEPDSCGNRTRVGELYHFGQS